ncbi:hypothetical protein [Adhaeribacter terreus]|uniref:Uncharacterized protein n=1 Tax=Adhaeribacter terreus TaxID=529703 RepID=A0ABW0E8G3_9BACT
MGSRQRFANFSGVFAYRFWRGEVIYQEKKFVFNTEKKMVSGAAFYVGIKQKTLCFGASKLMESRV